MSNKDQPKYVGSIYCPIIAPDTSKLNRGILILPEEINPPTAESDKEFIEQLMEEISKPLDPDAPNTGCIH